MTVRLCLLGNSHLAALALAWREMAPRYPGVTLTFFGAKARYLEGLQVSARGLRAGGPALRRMVQWFSGGLDEIVVADYDAFWFIDHEFGLNTVLDVYRDCWAEGHCPDPTRIPVSDLFFAELCVGALRRTLSIILYRRLRQVTDAPARILCPPAPSILTLRSPQDERHASFRLADRQGDAAELERQAEAALTRIEREEGVAISRQPAATRAGPLHTLETFGRDSVRLEQGLTTKHGPYDFMHMNADYGALVLEANLSALGEAQSLGAAMTA